jgi:hypothetical protein
MFIKMLIWTLLTKGFFYYRCLESITSVHIKMLNMQTVCSSVFSGKNNKELTVPCVLLWPALFLFTLPSSEMLPVECSVADWERRAGPLAGFPQTQRNIVFCLVLLNYMTSRLCFWCYILLLTQPFFWCNATIGWWLTYAHWTIIKQWFVTVCEVYTSNWLPHAHCTLTICYRKCS